jgi:hypothetical protein
VCSGKILFFDGRYDVLNDIERGTLINPGTLKPRISTTTAFRKTGLRTFITLEDHESFWFKRPKE